MVLGIRSDPVLVDRTDLRPAGRVLVELARDSGVALHRQIEASIRESIRSGRLPRGTALPPTRQLAVELGVSRGVVVEAYQQLVAEGYLTSRSGGYTRVAIGPEGFAEPAPTPAPAPAIDFCPCRADGSMFPRSAWLRSIRRILHEASDADFGYVHGRGEGGKGEREEGVARAAALRWARDRDALIVEDDYDAEYRYDRAPIGALQGLAPERVIYAGTASKTLAPGLRLGWLVVPTRLVDAISEAKTLADRGSPVLDQMAFADFLARGEFDRHLRRMRPVYRRRRDALLAALRMRLPELEPAGIAAGLHLVAYLPDGLDESTLIDAVGRRGVAIYGLAPYRLSSDGRAGLIFGYATLEERTISAGVGVVADVVEACAATGVHAGGCASRRPPRRCSPAGQQAR